MLLIEVLTFSCQVVICNLNCFCRNIQYAVLLLVIIQIIDSRPIAGIFFVIIGTLHPPFHFYSMQHVVLLAFWSLFVLFCFLRITRMPCGWLCWRMEHLFLLDFEFVPYDDKKIKIKAGGYSIYSIGLILISLSNNFRGRGGSMRKLLFQLIHLQT